MGLFCWQHIMSLFPLRRQSLASLFKHWPPMPDSRAVCLNWDIAISGLFTVLILRNAIQPRGSRFYVGVSWIEHTAAYPSYFSMCVEKCVENGKSWKHDQRVSELGILQVNHGTNHDKPWQVFPPSGARDCGGHLWNFFWSCLVSSHIHWCDRHLQCSCPKFQWDGGKTLLGTPVHPLVSHQFSSSLITFRKKMPFNSHEIAMKSTSPCFKKITFCRAPWPPWHWQNSWPKHRPSSASVQRHQEPAAPILETEPNLPDEQDDQWLLSLHWCCFSHWSFRGILVVLVVVAVVVVVGFNPWLSWLVLVVAAAVAVVVALQLES